MWQLYKEENGKRVYMNSATNSQCVTNKVYQDKDGNDWYGFDNLTSIPYTRQFAATKISSLYALGLSKDDLSNHINGLKTILKSQDKEKYVKAFALVLDFETKASQATDAIKQMSSLVCVYFLLADEPIDSFDQNLQVKKMSLLEADIEMHGFFLKMQIEATERYSNFLQTISETALAPMAEFPEALQ